MSPRRVFLVALCLLPWPPTAADTVLETFPLIVEAGRPAGADSGPTRSRESGAMLFPDLPFSLQRGYGYVGGAAEERTGTRALGGRPDWPLLWREGVEKYMFRVPRGEYLVELTFIETDVGQPGLRVFDVTAEGRELFPAVDLCKLAGDFAWVTLGGRVRVYDGWLDLSFSPRDGSAPARLSRLRLARWEDSADAVAGAISKSPPVAVLEALGGPGCNVLFWTPRLEPGVAGYGVFRSEAPGGPFRSVTQEPILTSRYVDHHVVVGRTYHYRLCVYGVDGTQSEFSTTVDALPKRPEDLGLPVYNLRVALESLRSMSLREAGEVRVPAELVHLGAVFHVFLSYDTSLERWHRKKCFELEIDRDRSRLFQRRSKLYLSAEAGDSSFLRELLSQEAHRTLGLAAPRVAPIVLTVNKRFEGIYLDRETVGIRFRRRTRLESRSGLLAGPTRRDHLRMDWRPYGEKVGKPGEIFSLTWFIHELNRVGTGEAEDFLENRLYLDRGLNRTALAIVAGGEESVEGHPRPPEAERFLLEDSRNRKWEWISPHGRSGEWGIPDFEPIRAQPTPEEVAVAFTRGTPFGSSSRDASWSVLATRLWNQPALRERLVGRVEALAAGSLSPEVIDGFVDRLFEQVKEVVRMDPHQVRPPGTDAFGRQALADVPALLKEAYRARVALLERAVGAERSRGPEPVVLNEILLRPRQGKPWIELQNRGDVDARLDEYSLSTDPAHTGTRLSGTLPARGYSKWTLEDDSPLSLPPSGGRICLFHGKSAPGADGVSPSDARLVDLLFYGHQTEGIPYGRKPEDGEWGALARATPAAENETRELVPPPYTFRHRAELEKNGDVLLSLFPRVRRRGLEARPEEVSLVQRSEGQPDFERVALRWDETRHQFLIGVKKETEPRRMEYYFLARSPDGVERVFPLTAPELTLSIPVRPEVKINEVLPRPDRRNAQEEFIEIYNPTDEAVDLEGMFLTDRRTLPTKWRIPAGNTVPPRGYLVFYTRGQAPGQNVDFNLRNSGEFLGLYGRIEEGNLPIDTIGFKGVRGGQSWGRTQDGTKSFRAWKDPTPGARNMPKIPEELLRKDSPEK